MTIGREANASNVAAQLIVKPFVKILLDVLSMITSCYLFDLLFINITV